MKTLIVAEKPSVAGDIARALGVPRSGALYESDDIVITNCIGHLVEIYTPLMESRDTPLPILPDEFELRVIDKTRDQFKVVKEQMKRNDVGKVANACDAGREGEAIFRLVYEKVGCTKPMERLWLQSMTPGGIKSAWKERKPGSAYDNLAAASRCRGEADLLVGINGSRAAKSAVGRVMTPTLAMVVHRYLENKNFKPKDYYEVVGTFGVAAGEYLGRWVQPGAQEGDGGEDADNRYRITDRDKAEAIVAKCKNVPPSSVSDDTKPTRSSPPLLFDLTTLQRDANRRFKFSAQKTLDIAQALYERHKATSYPRTESSALPEDYVAKATATVEKLAAVIAYEPHARRIADNGWVKPAKRIFNDAKISDHYAIIPTGVIPDGLTVDESKIYDLICRRFLAIFHPDAEYLSTVRTSVVAGETFRSTGRVMTEPGWHVVYGGVVDDGDKTPPLVPIKAKEPVKNIDIVVKSLKTRPPALFTEATLLAAMQTAGKVLDDEEIADAMKERGLGTPATRAPTIEKLLARSKGKDGKPKEPFMVRSGNNLEPTGRGIKIIEYLDRVAPKLTSPVLTGEWEFQLKRMERGEVARPRFMQDIGGFVREIVSAVDGTAAGIARAGSQKDPIDAECPRCGEAVVADERVCSCSKCDFRMWRVIAGKKLTPVQLKKLVEKGHLETIEGFLSKEKKPFAAGLKLDLTGETPKIDFIFEKREGRAAKPTKPYAGKCPACGGSLATDGANVTCTKDPCRFRLHLTVAKKPLAEADVQMLLKGGTTKQLDGFISSKGRPFRAALQLAADRSGKVEFLFERD